MDEGWRAILPEEKHLEVGGVGVGGGGGPGQLLHQQRVLGDALDGLEEVEGEGHALHALVRLALPHHRVELRPGLHLGHHHPQDPLQDTAEFKFPSSTTSLLNPTSDP